MDLLRLEDLDHSESIKDGLPKEKELEFLNESMTFIKDIGERIRSTQVCISTAQVYFQKFAYKRAYRKFDRFFMATVCLILASKSNEEAKPFNGVCKVYITLINEKRKVKTPPVIPDTMIENMRKNFHLHEFQLLKEIDFQFTVQMPYPCISQFYQSLNNLDPQTRENFLRIAYNFANDSFRTQVPLIKEASNIGQACIYLAARYLDLDLNLDADPITVSVILDQYQKYIL